MSLTYWTCLFYFGKEIQKHIWTFSKPKSRNEFIAERTIRSRLMITKRTCFHILAGKLSCGFVITTNPVISLAWAHGTNRPSRKSTDNIITRVNVGQVLYRYQWRILYWSGHFLITQKMGKRTPKVDHDDDENGPIQTGKGKKYGKCCVSWV